MKVYGIYKHITTTTKTYKMVTYITENGKEESINLGNKPAEILLDDENAN